MAILNFNTTNATLRQLLGNGLTYHVPPFQRDYSWGDDEWDDLWQDAIALFSPEAETAHYLGYLVLQSTDNKHFDIIDGQQRLTTLSIMILAGLAHLQDLITADLDAANNQRRLEQLQNTYIGYLDPVSLTAHPKLELNRHNNRYYQTYLIPRIQPLPHRHLKASEQQLRQAFNWFKNHLQKHHGMHPDSGQNFAAFIDSLVDKLFFTVITVTDQLNAFKVFETLNARGVRLSATDLLKNYLFSIVDSPTTHPNELQTLETTWEHIVDLLGSESFPDFLRVFWNSRHPLTRKADLFKTIRHQIGDRPQAFTLIRHLDQFAHIYTALRDPQDPDWNPEERTSLAELRLFNVRQPLALLMASHHRYFESDRPTFGRILKAIAILSFRYNIICNLPTSEQEQQYNHIAQKISNGTYQTEPQILTALHHLNPEDAQFKAAFTAKEMRTGNPRNKKIVRYILFAIEKQQYGHDFDLESARYSIEHILPENPTAAWADIDPAQQDRLIYRLGNMTPLETSFNRDLGNQSYEIKCPIYQTSQFKMTQAIAAHYTTWNEAKIAARQQQLAKIAAGIWRINFGGINR